MSSPTPEVCVHGDDRGTTSSNLVDLPHREPEESSYYFADGKPCETEYERVF
ncbi:MAG: hypothetical protein SV760_10340 [Halobacteria archaeon]|nr:hypothetical protein [Halobacteria archaeon]